MNDQKTGQIGQAHATVVCDVVAQAARDDGLWQSLWSRSGFGSATLSQLRDQIRERTVQGLPEPWRRRLLGWPGAVRLQAVRRALDAGLAATSELGEQRSAWEQACLRATKQETSFLGRWRCLRLARRQQLLSRQAYQVRLAAEAAEKRSENALMRCSAARMVVEKYLGVFLSQHGAARPAGSTSSRATQVLPILRALEGHLARDLEQGVFGLLSERVRVLAERKELLVRELEALRAKQSESERLLHGRADVLLLMRQHYEIRRNEWPSQAVERSMLGVLHGISFDLGEQREALEVERAELRQNLREAHIRVLVRMERVSRYVVPSVPVAEPGPSRQDSLVQIGTHQGFHSFEVHT